MADALPFIQQVRAAVAAFQDGPARRMAQGCSFSTEAAAEFCRAVGGIPMPGKKGLIHSGKRKADGAALFGLSAGYWWDPEQREPIVVWGGADA